MERPLLLSKSRSDLNKANYFKTWRCLTFLSLSILQNSIRGQSRTNSSLFKLSCKKSLKCSHRNMQDVHIRVQLNPFLSLQQHHQQNAIITHWFLMNGKGACRSMYTQVWQPHVDERTPTLNTSLLTHTQGRRRARCSHFSNTKTQYETLLCTRWEKKWKMQYNKFHFL